MSSARPFVARALEGDVLDLREVDEDVKRWHESTGPACPLHEWLGMTHAEYALWVERPAILKYILQARKYGIPLPQHLASIESFQSAPRIAARAPKAEVGSLVEWLRSTGRLPNGSRPKNRP